MKHKYVMSGRSEEYHKYAKQHPKDTVFYVNNPNMIDSITGDDTLVLLRGWWGRSWAIEMLKSLKTVYPSMTIEYNDGHFGEEIRNGMFEQESKLIRFSLMDIDI